VPEMVWRDVTRFSEMAGESAPRMSFCEAEVKSARPAMGRYSWLRSGSEWRMSSACQGGVSMWKGIAAEYVADRVYRTFLTTGRIHGTALLSRYAPMPRSTFLGSLSARYAAMRPNSGSSGACCTAPKALMTALEDMSSCWLI
jgi:hypothetical protein